MATSYTPRLALPEMADGEGSGYVTFNELGQILDAYLQSVVQSKVVSTPPAVPVDGECWLVAAGATGDWSGRDGQLAQYYDSAWHYYSTFTGMRMWVIDESAMHYVP